jgi:transposase
MIGLPAIIRVFVAVGASDLRRGFDGLAQLARDRLEQDPMTGHLFAFANRKRDRIKILYWDQSGFAIWMKRLERGSFNWPRADATHVEFSATELAALLGGIDLATTRRRVRYTGTVA